MLKLCRSARTSTRRSSRPVWKSKFKRPSSRGLVVSHWLISTQVPIMLDGMAELVKVRPEDPILWMSEYLRDNNPNTNADAAARAAKRRRLDEEARAAEAAKPAV